MSAMNAKSTSGAANVPPKAAESSGKPQQSSKRADGTEQPSKAAIAEPQKSNPLLPPVPPEPSDSLQNVSVVSRPKQSKKGKDSGDLYQETSKILFIASICALMGALSMGLTLGWSAPAFDTLEDADSVPRLTADDKEVKTWIGSALTLGALIGALFSGSASSILGRKKAVIVYGIPFLFGWLLIIMARSFSFLIAGRALLGISAGLTSGTIPSYLVEVSPIKYRGSFGACFQLSITIGIFLVYLFGMFLSWRSLSCVSAIPPIIMSLGMTGMPESPGWLLAKGQTEDALKALRRLRGRGSNIEGEIKAIQQEAESSKDRPGFTLRFYSKAPHLIPFILALGLMFFQQFSGINTVMFYATDIFKEAGGTIAPQKATAIIGATQVFATLISSLIIDRVGRKFLLILSGSLHVISLAMLGIFYMSESKNNAGWMPVTSLVIFIIGFSFGWGPIPWLMTAEICPLESRSTTASIATVANWLCAFLIVKNFEMLKDALTKHGAFFLFSVFSFLSIIFTVFMLPETKSKTPEQIGKNFQTFNMCAGKVKGDPPVTDTTNSTNTSDTTSTAKTVTGQGNSTTGRKNNDTPNT